MKNFDLAKAYLPGMHTQQGEGSRVVQARAIVPARVVIPLVGPKPWIQDPNRSVLTRHADTAEGPRVVQARAVVPARVALALVDVGLASGTGEANGAVARE